MSRKAALLIASLLSLPVVAAPSAVDLVRQSDKRHRVPAEKTRSRMVLQDAAQKEEARVREVESVSIQDEKAGDKMRVRFLGPADVKGTALLSVENKGGEDEQWLFLPAFRKTRRIGQAELGDRFMGTDFAYEDMQRRVIEDYSYQLLPDEKVEGQDCWVIEATPSAPKVVKESPYGKRVLWMRKDNLFVVRARFFDKKGAPLKQLDATKLKNIGGEAWRADEIVLVDVQRKHRTVVQITQRESDPKLGVDAFTKQALETE